MEINTMHLGKSQMKIIKVLDRFMAAYRMSKNDRRNPESISLDRRDYADMEKTLSAKKCTPPYTYKGVRIEPRDLDND
jgi:hypothetical protein